jgi:hypothetical protein
LVGKNGAGYIYREYAEENEKKSAINKRLGANVIH